MGFLDIATFEGGEHPGMGIPWQMQQKASGNSGRDGIHSHSGTQKHPGIHIDHDFLMGNTALPRSWWGQSDPPDGEGLIQVETWLEKEPGPPAAALSLQSGCSHPWVAGGVGSWGKHPQPSESRCSIHFSVIYSFIHLFACWSLGFVCSSN